jgi:hypothetical protein
MAAVRTYTSVCYKVCRQRTAGITADSAKRQRRAVHSVATMRPFAHTPHVRRRQRRPTPHPVPQTRYAAESARNPHADNGEKASAARAGERVRRLQRLHERRRQQRRARTAAPVPRVIYEQYGKPERHRRMVYQIVGKVCVYTVMCGKAGRQV